MPNYDEWVVYLLNAGWAIPAWLDKKQTADSLEPVMYGHLGLTIKTIISLFAFFRMKRKHDDMDIINATDDQAKLLDEISSAMTGCFTFYEIATALYNATLGWNGLSNQFYKRFRHKLDWIRSRSSLTTLEAGRTDLPVTAIKFMNWPGCVPPILLFDATETNASNKDGEATEGDAIAPPAGKKEDGKENKAQANNNNNNNNNNRNNNNNALAAHNVPLFNPAVSIKSNLADNNGNFGNNNDFGNNNNGFDNNNNGFNNNNANRNNNGFGNNNNGFGNNNDGFGNNNNGFGNNNNGFNNNNNANRPNINNNSLLSGKYHLKIATYAQMAKQSIDADSQTPSFRHAVRHLDEATLNNMSAEEIAKQIKKYYDQRSAALWHELPQTVDPYVSPSGRLYPDPQTLQFPSEFKKSPLYAPKLIWFGFYLELPRDPARLSRHMDESFLLYNLDHCRPFYCANFNAGDRRCNDDTCIYYHYCEWCAAAAHIGNRCPYRPDVPPRKRSEKNFQRHRY